MLTTFTKSNPKTLETIISMKMKTSSDSALTSLLSVYLSTDMEISQLSVTTVPLPSESTEEPLDQLSKLSSTEPPLSLQTVMSYGNSLSTQRIPPQAAFSRNRSICPLSNNLAASPLTSCSYQTMRKEYDMDTWRMYERIQAKRDQSDEIVLSIVREAVDHIQSEDHVNSHGRPLAEPQCQEECDDSDGIFELEL
jgi:hypothetical protein